jgi:tetratricopeptide (TPR) repeat protein
VAHALQIDQQLCHLEPTRAIHFFSAGNMLTVLKRYELAEQAFQKVIDLEPKRADGYRALAQLYLVTKKNDQLALSLANQAVSLSPAAPVHVLVSLARERNGDRAGALQAVRKAIELEPRNAEYRRRYEKLQQEN